MKMTNLFVTALVAGFISAPVMAKDSAKPAAPTDKAAEKSCDCAKCSECKDKSAKKSKEACGCKSASGCEHKKEEKAI